MARGKADVEVIPVGKPVAAAGCDLLLKPRVDLGAGDLSYAGVVVRVGLLRPRRGTKGEAEKRSEEYNLPAGLN